MQSRMRNYKEYGKLTWCSIKMLMSSDTDDGVMDGRQNGSAPMPFLKELAVERVSECYTSQKMNVPVAR